MLTVKWLRVCCTKHANANAKHTAWNCVALLRYPTEIALEHCVHKKCLPKSNTAAEVVIGKISPVRAECSYPDAGLNSPAPLESITDLHRGKHSFILFHTYAKIHHQGRAIDCIRIHPQHLELSSQGFSCLKDPERDVKIAPSHAGASCLIRFSYLHFCNSLSPGKPILPIFTVLSSFSAALYRESQV